MGFTSIGDKPNGPKFEHKPPRVYMRLRWNEPWALSPFQFLEADYRVAGAGSSTASFCNYYGDEVKLPDDNRFSSREALDLRNWFCKIEAYDREFENWKIIFQGTLRNDSRNIMNSPNTTVGIQTFVADGPLSDLARIDVYRSVWANEDLILDIKKIAWLPAMNVRGPQATLVGNRSSDPDDDDVYLHGGKNVWNHLQYLRYLIKYFVNEANNVFAPKWTISGQTGILEQLETSREWGHSANLAEMLKKLIPREFGLDYKINYRAYGYDLFIFTLIPDDSELYGVTLSRNPNTVRITPGNMRDLVECKVVRSNERACDGFRIIGERVVMCATLSMAGAFATTGAGGGELTKGWTDDLEEEYIQGAGMAEDDDFTPKEHDKARQRERFRDVFQKFTIESEWDFGGGDLSPKIGLDGVLDVDEVTEFQSSVNGTLTWIPLISGFDYSTTPETDNNLPLAEPAPIQPLAWVYDSNIDSGVGDEAGSAGFVEVHHSGISLGILKHELGLLLNASPNHILSLNHRFAEGSDEEGSTLLPAVLYDYETICATLAWYMDKYLEIGVDLDDFDKAGDGSLKVIHVPDCEMWLLAANTVVGTNKDGTFKFSGDKMRVLRDDSTRLKMAGAGAKARYIEDRVRAEIVLKTVNPWTDYVGQVLTTIEEPGGSTGVGAPITSMKWICKPKGVGMSFQTGYAGL